MATALTVSTIAIIISVTVSVTVVASVTLGLSLSCGFECATEEIACGQPTCKRLPWCKGTKCDDPTTFCSDGVCKKKDEIMYGCSLSANNEQMCMIGAPSGGKWNKSSDCKCWKCGGITEDSTGSCEVVEDNDSGKFNTLDECNGEVGKCGWRYICRLAK